MNLKDSLKLIISVLDLLLCCQAASHSEQEWDIVMIREVKCECLISSSKFVDQKAI